MENKNLNPRESIELISRMIDIRKTNWNDSGHILRMWGWLILAASIAHFILLEFEFYRIFWTPWLITIAGAVYTLIFFTRLGKKQGKSGFLDKLSGFLWWLFAINAFALGFGFTFFFGHMGTGIILIMLGFASALDGKIMQFRPMITGGLITNVLGLFTLGWMLLVYKEVVTEQNFLILLVGVGITLTNIIPGYIMKSEFKKMTR
jgi:hypothetical protein